MFNPGIIFSFFIVVASLSVQAQDEASDIAAVKRLLANGEAAFNAGNLALGVSAFADDGIIIPAGNPVIVGIDEIENAYLGLLAAFDLKMALHSEEFVHAGDIIYERGTYTMDLLDKTTGERVQGVNNNHIHVFKRQADGQ
jgi:ketosteroid isomerase-like protein